MNLLSKKLVVALSATCLMSGSAFALTKAEVEVLKDKMASVKVVEAPSAAAKLLSGARKIDRQETAVAIVKAVAEAHSPALGKVITVVLTRVPEATDAVVRAALDAAPGSAGVIVAAVARANPEQLNQVGALAQSLVPSESISISREVAFARAQATPLVAAPTPTLARPVALGVFGGGATVTQSNATFDVTVTNVTTTTNGGVVTTTTNTTTIQTTNVVVTVENGYGGADPNRPH